MIPVLPREHESAGCLRLFFYFPPSGSRVQPHRIPPVTGDRPGAVRFMPGSITAPDARDRRMPPFRDPVSPGGRTPAGMSDAIAEMNWGKEF